MVRLALVLYSLIATSLAGAGVIAVLASGHGTLWPIVGAAAVGAALAVPVALLVARAMEKA